MTVRIRAARPDDYDAIELIENAADQRLIERLQPDEWRPAPSGVERANEPGFLLVAEHASEPVGFVHVLEYEAIAHLEQISVLPAYGGRGYGRALIDAAKTAASARGHVRLTLRTYVDVPWNAPFYEKARFVVEAPATPFHRSLLETETRLGLERYGARVQMGVDLHPQIRKARQMTRTPLFAPAAPEALGPYSHGIAASGELVFLSGQTPVDPATGALVAGDISVQAERVFANLSTVLESGGLTLADAIKVNVFLVDMADFAAMNEVYARVFPHPFPARTTVAVAGLPLNARIEVELTAVRRDTSR